MHFQLLREQMPAGNFEFFLKNVARKADLFHPVQQGCRDRFKSVGGADEKNLGKIKADVQIVIQKILVLLRVQHFQQC